QHFAWLLHEELKECALACSQLNGVLRSPTHPLQRIKFQISDPDHCWLGIIAFIDECTQSCHQNRERKGFREKIISANAEGPSFIGFVLTSSQQQNGSPDMSFAEQVTELMAFLFQQSHVCNNHIVVVLARFE